jgi:heme-degrading monooxygenase HmoA
MTVHQLRIYEIDPTKRDAFHERFRDHAVRIMQSYGFRILAMWESDTEGRLEFIYLLEWSDQVTLEQQWEQFMAESWSRIKAEVRAAIGGEPVLNVTSRVLEIVDYPPNRLSSSGRGDTERPEP